MNRRKPIIIIDLSQVMMANFSVQFSRPHLLHNGYSIEDTLRHMVLNSIRMNKTKFKQEFGDEIVIACDGKRTWRYEFFPLYKAKRKENKKASHIDWAEVYRCFNLIRDEIKNVFSYKTILIEDAEADDIIGTLCHVKGRLLGGDPILILSGDKDFAQLQKYSNVRQYDPTRKKWVEVPNPEKFLFEHIIRGDAGDGVPNSLSPDNIFMVQDRQTNIMAAKLEAWYYLYENNVPIKEIFEPEQLRNWHRNKTLIDLTQIPDDVSARILVEYHAQENKIAKNVFGYFIQKKLKNLMESIHEF